MSCVFVGIYFMQPKKPSYIK